MWHLPRAVGLALAWVGIKVVEEAHVAAGMLGVGVGEQGTEMQGTGGDFIQLVVVTSVFVTFPSETFRVLHKAADASFGAVPTSRTRVLVECSDL